VLCTTGNEGGPWTTRVPRTVATAPLASTGGVADAAGVVEGADAADAVDEGGVGTMQTLRTEALILSSVPMVELGCKTGGGTEEHLSLLLSAADSCRGTSRFLVGGITNGIV